MGRQPALVGHQLGQQHLAPAGGVEVGALLHLGQVLAHPQRRHDVADPEAGHHQLGERAEGEHVVAPGGDRREVLAGEPQGPVGVVLHHEEAVLLGEGREPPAAIEGEGGAGRVLEVHDRVHEAGPFAPDELLLQDVDVEPVGVDGDGQEARLEHRQRLDGADVARLVDADDVARIEEHLVTRSRACCDPWVTSTCSASTGRSRRAAVWRATHARRSGEPSVVEYWSRAAGRSRSTRSVISRSSSTGKASGAGRPPASEIMPGCSVTFSRSRMADERRPAIRPASGTGSGSMAASSRGRAAPRRRFRRRPAPPRCGER